MTPLTIDQLKSAVRVFRRALALLGPRGENWTQKTWVRYTGPSDDIRNTFASQAGTYKDTRKLARKHRGLCKFCLDGALMVASPNESALSNARRALSRFGPILSEDISIINFNDREKQRFSTIRRELEGAIDAIKARMKGAQ